MDRSELVLPEGTLDRIERHVAGPTRHREALLAGNRHLSRAGSCCGGRPARGRRTRCATSSGAFGGDDHPSSRTTTDGARRRACCPGRASAWSARSAGFAEERFGPFGGGGAVLFELMNEMSGLGKDADVAFVLTTNRPDALEPALAARPGRVHLAVEIPLPNATARRVLLDLYARGLDARIENPAAIVARTEGMTASFFRELLRKAALEVAEEGRGQVTDADLEAALDDLLADRSALTRVLLSGRAPRLGEEVGPLYSDHWLSASPGFGSFGTEEIG